MSRRRDRGERSCEDFTFSKGSVISIIPTESKLLQDVLRKDLLRYTNEMKTRDVATTSQNKDSWSALDTREFYEMRNKRPRYRARGHIADES